VYEIPPAHSDDPRLDGALTAARGLSQGAFVRFEQRGKSEVVAIVNAGIAGTAGANWPREVTLSTDHGVPLREVPHALEFRAPLGGQKLAGSVQQEGAWRIRPVALLDDKRNPVHHLKHLWSSDGRMLYVLTDKGGLMQIDADNWEVKFAFHPWDRSLGFVDIAWSSTGLIALQSSGAVDPSWGTPWIALDPDPHVDSRHPNFRLFVLDPQAMQARKCWFVRGHRLAGHPGSAQVYVSFVADQRLGGRGRLQVIDTARGQISNSIEGTAVRAESQVEKEPPRGGSAGEPGVSVDCPVLTPDGKWLLNLPEPSGFEQNPFAEISRFRIGGPRLQCEQRIRNLTRNANTRIKSTTDSRYLCLSYQQDPGFYFLEIADFSRPARSIANDESYDRMFVDRNGGAIAVDSETKTLFVLPPAERVETKTLVRVIQGDHVVTLPLRANANVYPLLPDDLDLRPKHHGVFASTLESCYWIEGGEAASLWRFERPER
jgi:hypothetical protein